MSGIVHPILLLSIFKTSFCTFYQPIPHSWQTDPPSVIKPLPSRPKTKTAKSAPWRNSKGANWCCTSIPRTIPGCTAEACNLRDHYERFLQAGYRILGVSADSPASHTKFRTKYKLPFDLLADQDHSVHEAYATWVEKSMYGRKYMGTDRVTFVIDEQGKVEEVIAKVDTKNHSAQILG